MVAKGTPSCKAERWVSAAVSQRPVTQDAEKQSHFTSVTAAAQSRLRPQLLTRGHGREIPDARNHCSFAKRMEGAYPNTCNALHFLCSAERKRQMGEEPTVSSAVAREKARAILLQLLMFDVYVHLCIYSSSKVVGVKKPLMQRHAASQQKCLLLTEFQNKGRLTVRDWSYLHTIYCISRQRRLNRGLTRFRNYL